MPSSRGRHSCLCRDLILEILLPGLQADYLSAALPILQAAVRYVVDVLVASILLVEKLCLQKLARGHQTKSMYIK